MEWSLKIAQEIISHVHSHQAKQRTCGFIGYPLKSQSNAYWTHLMNIVLILFVYICKAGRDPALTLYYSSTSPDASIYIAIQTIWLYLSVYS